MNVYGPPINLKETSQHEHNEVQVAHCEPMELAWHCENKSGISQRYRIEAQMDSNYIANWIGVRGRRPRAHSPTPTMPPPTNEVDEGCCPHIATKKGLVN